MIGCGCGGGENREVVMSFDEFLIVAGYVRLLRAIKEQAEKDGAFDSFASYWYYSPELSAIWRAVCSEVGAVVNFL